MSVPVPAIGFGNEAAQRRNTLLDRRTGDEALAGLRFEPGLKFFPEALVRPGIGVFGVTALEIVAAARRRARRAEREAERVPDVDQLLRDRRRIGPPPPFQNP